MKLLLLSLFFMSCDNSRQTATGSDSIIKTRLNQPFEIRLEADFSAGYSWSVADSSYKTYLSLDTVLSVNKTDKDGSPSIQVMRFHGLKTGEYRLHLIYTHPWMEFAKPKKEAHYTIRIQ